jgi:hypothetical protein
MPCNNKNIKSIEKYLQSLMSLSFSEQVGALLRLRLPEDEASTRAVWIVEDMRLIGFNLRISVPKTANEFHATGLPIPLEYEIEETGFSVNNDQAHSAFDGTHLNKGDLAILSKICEIGRAIPEIGWPKFFESRLNTGKEHLAVLNEIWWLGRFVRPRNVFSEYQMDGAKGKVDWRFDCGPSEFPMTVNLEVKRRPSNISKSFLSKSTSLLTKISKKFPSNEGGVRTDTSLNVVAITIYSDIDRKLIDQTIQWLKDNRSVDAVVLFSFKSDVKTPWLVVPSRIEDILGRICLILPDEEDLWTVAQITYADYKRAESLGLPIIKPMEP